MFTLSEYRLFTVAMRYLFDDNTTTDNDGASPHKHQKLINTHKKIRQQHFQKVADVFIM
jgi:hypothetical protein